MIFMYVLHGFYPLFRMNQYYPYKTGSKQIKFYAHKKSDGVFLSRCHLVVTSLSLQQLHITPSLRRSVPPFSSFAPARPSHQKGNKKLRCSSEATLPNLWTHTFLSFSPKSLGFRHLKLTLGPRSLFCPSSVSVCSSPLALQRLSPAIKQEWCQTWWNKEWISKLFCLSPSSHISFASKKSLSKDSRLFTSKKGRNKSSFTVSSSFRSRASLLLRDFLLLKQTRPSNIKPKPGERATKLRLWTVHGQHHFPIHSMFPL